MRFCDLRCDQELAGSGRFFHVSQCEKLRAIVSRSKESRSTMKNWRDSVGLKEFYREYASCRL